MYARRIGAYPDEDGNYEMVIGPSDRFIRIFAGDIDGRNEIGRVWKASTIIDLYNRLK
ncbi:MAG: hypothetical protein M3Y72_16995 [Acidobacteriota bacterium]|nr:hypothetical protein [Acidobacteriota bacterium]